MSLIDTVRRHLPVKYRELAKFLVVGGTSYVVDVGLFTLLSHTVLENKVITAKAISILVATIVSYILNREWSFSRRGGREKHHEAMLFFLVNGIALGLNLVPLALSQYVFGIQHHELLLAHRHHRELHLGEHHRHDPRYGLPLLGLPQVGLPRGTDAAPGVCCAEALALGRNAGAGRGRGQGGEAGSAAARTIPTTRRRPTDQPVTPQ